MVTVKSVDVISVGKVLGCLYALMGLLAGGLFSLLSVAGVAIGGQNAGPAALLFGVGAIVVLPLIYGVGGFIGGIISGVLYNIVASMTGGIELELSRREGM